MALPQLWHCSDGTDMALPFAEPWPWVPLHRHGTAMALPCHCHDMAMELPLHAHGTAIAMCGTATALP